MSAGGFFQRWSRLKANGGEAADAALPPAPAAPVPMPPAASAAPSTPHRAEAVQPTLEDAARLTPDADFSAFVGQGVDKAVQRLALKRLFADPHFKVMDGLDMYMDDYNKPSPMSAAMLAALDHARGALRLPGQAEPTDTGAAAAATGAASGVEADAVSNEVTDPAPGSAAGLAPLPTAAPENGTGAYTGGEDRAPASGPALSSLQGPA